METPARSLARARGAAPGMSPRAAVASRTAPTPRSALAAILRLRRPTDAGRGRPPDSVGLQPAAAGLGRPHRSRRKAIHPDKRRGAPEGAKRVEVR